MTINVEEESYYEGYNDAYKQKSAGCQSTQSSEKYFGHTAKYWQDTFTGLIPVLVIVGLLLLWSHRSRKKYWRHIDDVNKINDKMFANHEIMHATLLKTNGLLQQLIEKLDKR